jgi:hypothetical protein
MFSREATLKFKLRQIISTTSNEVAVVLGITFLNGG